jgi:DNA-binding transcriptional ArsR family regulator
MNSEIDPIEFAKALSDPTRQKIMKLCCCDWLSVGELADELKVTQPTVSHHLAFLRDANLVHIRPEGRQTFYTLNQSSVASCCGFLMLNFAPDIQELV